MRRISTNFEYCSDHGVMYEGGNNNEPAYC